MGMFIEVDSVEKNCPVIINLDQVLEIAPLVSGGCALFFSDGAGMNSKSAMKVKNDYSQFKQFAMQTVSSEDIAKRIETINKAAGIEKPAKPKPQVKIPKFDGTVTDEE
jgi:hypothetical protein